MYTLYIFRLLVNLTQPAILCFNNTVPTEKSIRNYYIEIETILQSYKEVNGLAYGV